MQKWSKKVNHLRTVSSMAILVVEFSNGGYKIRKVLPKNQHTQRKFFNFENWISGDLRTFLILYPPIENSTTRIAIVSRLLISTACNVKPQTLSEEE